MARKTSGDTQALLNARPTLFEPITALSSEDRRKLSWVLAGLIALGCVVFQWNLAGNERTDTRIYYLALESMKHGALYDYGSLALNFIYPPFAAILMWPLLALDIEVATRTMMVLSVPVALGSYVIALRHTPLQRNLEFVPLVAAGFLFAPPALETFVYGQINAILGLAVVIDAILIARRHRFGGVLIGLTAAIKLSPFLLVVALIVTGYRRAALTAIGSATIVTAASWLVLPDESHRFWTDVVFETGRIGSFRHADSASLRGVLDTAIGVGPVSTTLWFIGSTALAVAMWPRLRAYAHLNDVVGLVLAASMVSYIVSPLSWIHHLWFFPVALVSLAPRISERAVRVVLAVAVIGLCGASGILPLGGLVNTLLVASMIGTSLLMGPAPISRPN